MGLNIAAVGKHLTQLGPCAVVLLRREWTLEHWLKSQLGQKPAGSAAKDRQTEVAALLADFPTAETQVIVGFNGARSSWTEAVLILRR